MRMLWVAILFVAVVVLALATRRRRPVDPLSEAQAPAPPPKRSIGWRVLHSPDAVERAAQLLRQGNRVEAIEVFRAVAGLDPAEAEQAVAELERHLASGGPLAKLLDPSGGAKP
jgi:hypothetical protein